MKKWLLIGMGCLLGLGLSAQEELSRQLKETKVLPPRFEQPEEKKMVEVEKPSPLGEYIEKNLEMPDIDYFYTNEGVVAVEFTVNDEGELTNFIVTNSVSFDLDQAVIECLRTTDGMWVPGQVNGQPSPMEKKVYVKFDIPGNPPHEEMARLHYQDGVKWYNKALANEDGIEKREQRLERRGLRRSIIAFDETLRYSPDAAACLILQASCYERQGNEAMHQKKLEQYMEIVNSRAVQPTTSEQMDLAVIVLKK